MEFETKNTIPFTLAPLKLKYLDMNLTKCAQDLYEENYKTDEQNEVRAKYMKRLSMFMDEKTQCCLQFFPNRSSEPTQSQWK